jgi:hypothetical protein
VPCRRGDIPPRGAGASVSPSPRLEDDLAGALPRLDAPVRMRRLLERQHVSDVHLHLSRRDVADEVLQRRGRARPRPLGKPFSEGERDLGDATPAVVDREGVAPVRDLHDLRHGGVAPLPLVGGVRDRPRHRVVLLAVDDQQGTAARGALGPCLNVSRGVCTNVIGAGRGVGVDACNGRKDGLPESSGGRALL